MLGIVQNLLRWTFLDNQTFVEWRHPIRDLAGEPNFVSNHDHRHTRVCQVFHDSQKITDQVGVKSRGRFVKQHHLWRHRQRARDGYDAARSLNDTA
jgi:hypothetical protein